MLAVDLERRKRLTFSSPEHCDFRTPEYDILHTVSERKWEMCRGVGRSFGANRHELPEDIIGDTELIQMFCDVVSKNGNLLIGVGPRPDGTVPENADGGLLSGASEHGWPPTARPSTGRGRGW